MPVTVSLADAKSAQPGIVGAAFCLNVAKNQLAARRLPSDALFSLPVGRFFGHFGSALTYCFPAQQMSLANMMFLKSTKRGREQPISSHEKSADAPRSRLTMAKAATYVGRMTKAANEGRSLACQGLHNGPVLAYGFSHTVLLTVPCRFL